VLFHPTLSAPLSLAAQSSRQHLYLIPVISQHGTVVQPRPNSCHPRCRWRDPCSTGAAFAAKRPKENHLFFTQREAFMSERQQIQHDITGLSRVRRAQTWPLWAWTRTSMSAENDRNEASLHKDAVGLARIWPRVHLPDEGLALELFPREVVVDEQRTKDLV
jgi:hypothetical protein